MFAYEIYSALIENNNNNNKTLKKTDDGMHRTNHN